MEPTNQTTQPFQSPISSPAPGQVSSFGEAPFQDPRNSFGGRFQRIWQAVRYYAMQAWPYFQRLINFIIYQTIKVIKAIIRIGLSQTGIIKE